MKSTIISIVWVIIFIFFGIYIDKDIEKFTVGYIKEIENAYEVISDENWDESKEILDKLSSELETQRDLWLKVLNHQYYNDIELQLNLVKNNVNCKDKERSLEGMEKIKYILQNIIDDEKCSTNYIF